MPNRKQNKLHTDSLRKIAENQLKQSAGNEKHMTSIAGDLKLFHELQVHQVELEMQNEELIKAHSNLEHYQKKLTEIIEFTPNSYFTLNYRRIIQDVNLTGASLLGYDRSSLLNINFTEFINPEDQNVFDLYCSTHIETRKHQVCEVRIVRSDGQQLFVRLDIAITEIKKEFQILLILTDITLQKQIEDTQSFLLGNSWIESGKDFFATLAEYLAKTLGMDYVCIDRLIDNGLEAHTVAVYFDGHFEENISYELSDTPCGQVVGQSVCCFPREVRYLFPKDLILKEMLAESYIGITLWGSEGKPVGLIAVIGRKPIINTRSIEMVLKQVSIRAASELEHRQLEEAIITSRDKLEILVNERTAELQEANKLLKNEIAIRKQKEQHLKIAEEKYRTVADYTYDSETWLGPDGKFIYVSPSFKILSGYAVEDLLNDPELIIKMAHPDDRDIVAKHFSDKRKVNSSDCPIDFRIITKTGEERWVGHACQPVFNQEGKFLGQRGSNRDISERKKAESVLIDSQRHLRALTQRIDAIAEEERTHIAREIHDEFGHMLTVMKYDIEELRNNTGLSMELVKNGLESINSMIEAMIDTVRKIATELRPGILDHLGLFPAIEWQIEQFQLRTRICCDFDRNEIDFEFSKNETTIIFRILQEILTNVSRHSKATKVNVFTIKQDDCFILHVSDNGTGFELSNTIGVDSLGILGIQERALSIGGKIKIQSKPGKGTIVTFLLRRN